MNPHAQQIVALIGGLAIAIHRLLHAAARDLREGWNR